MQRLITFRIRHTPIKRLIAGLLVVLALNGCDVLNAIEAEFAKADVIVAGHDGETYELHAITQGSSPSVKVGTLAPDGTLEFFAAEDVRADEAYITAESLLCEGANAGDIDVTPATAEGTDIFIFGVMLALPAGTTVEQARAQAQAEQGGTVNVVATVPTDQLFESVDPNSVTAAPGLIFTPQATTFEVNCPVSYGNLDLQAGFNESLSSVALFGNDYAAQFLTTDVDPQAFDWNFGSVSNSLLFPE
jgi:hypothetical protein